MNKYFMRFLTPSEINNIMFINSVKKGFRIEKIGKSTVGNDLFMSILGTGKYKALPVGSPHPNEPVGGTLGVYFALNNDMLEALDCTIYFVHALEVDSSMKNLGWIRSKFSFEQYINNSFIDALENQAEFCFPCDENQNAYKIESAILLELFHRIRPDLYCPLHSSPTIGGAQFYLSKSDFKLITKLAELVNDHGVYIDEIPKGNNILVYTPGFFGLYSYKNLPVKHLASRETSYLYFRNVIKNHSVAFEIPFATTAQPAKTLIDKDYSEIIREFNFIVPSLAELINNLKNIENVKNKEMKKAVEYWTENWDVKPLKQINKKTLYKDMANIANYYFTILLLLNWWNRAIDSNNSADFYLKQSLNDMVEKIYKKFNTYRCYIKVIPTQEQIEIYAECFKLVVSYWAPLCRFDKN